MKIQNASGISHEELLCEIQKGARFVQFTYAVSFLFTTLNRKTDLFMIRAGEKRASKALPYIILTSIFGWWAFPFGPKHTLNSLRTNMKGGIDVTDEVTDTVAGFLLFKEAEQRKAS